MKQLSNLPHFVELTIAAALGDITRTWRYFRVRGVQTPFAYNTKEKVWVPMEVLVHKGSSPILCAPRPENIVSIDPNDSNYSGTARMLQDYVDSTSRPATESLVDLVGSGSVSWMDLAFITIAKRQVPQKIKWAFSRLQSAYIKYGILDPVVMGESDGLIPTVSKGPDGHTRLVFNSSAR